MRGCALTRVLSLPSGILLGLALLQLAGACSPARAPEETIVPFAAADASPSVPASAAADGADDTAVPFLICWSSPTWTRPSEKEQAREVWARPRYGAADVDKLRALLYEDFFPYAGGNSELFDSWPLHGLWTAEDVTEGDPRCERGGLRLDQAEVVSVFLLLHQAREIRFTGNTYRITVEAAPSGFQEIQFANSVSPIAPKLELAKERPTDYNLLIVDTSGREVAWAEGGIHFERLTETTPTASAAGVGP